MRRSLLLAGFCVYLSLGIAAAAEDVTVEGWKLQTTPSGQVEKMIMSNPSTVLQIENEISISLDQFGSVVSGNVHFNNGFEREMGQKEALTYWERCHGPRTLWNYWESQNKVSTVNTSGAIPADWFGKIVRMVALNDNEVIGTLVSSGSDQYAIKADNGNNGLIYFSMTAVKKLEMYSSDAK